MYYFKTHLKWQEAEKLPKKKKKQTVKPIKLIKLFWSLDAIKFVFCPITQADPFYFQNQWNLELQRRKYIFNFSSPTPQNTYF